MPSMKYDCGHKESMEGTNAVSAPKEETKPRIYYPGFSIQDEAAKAIAKNHQAGDTVKMMVTARITSIADNAKREEPWSEPAGSNVQLEVREIDIQDGEDAAISKAEETLGEI